MRHVLAVLAMACCGLAYGYDVTAVMPATEGATGCTLYMDGESVGGVRTCGAANLYPNLIDEPGLYEFAYTASNAGGESALSPVTVVSIEVIPPPADPGESPKISIACVDEDGERVPCPANLLITVTP